MMNECFSKNHDSPTALVAAICDPRFKLAIFERLWEDNPSYIKRANLPRYTSEKSKIPRSSHETTQYRDPRYRTLRQSRTRRDDVDDLFAGYRGRSNLATPESDNW